MELDWFLKEVEERTRWCDFPPLVTTCTDGENGGWFRNTTPGANFWSAFYLPLLERVRAGRSPVAPTFISNYLNAYGPMGEVSVETGAWNTGWHDGRDFIQWTGSDTQKASLEALAIQNRALDAARAQVRDLGLSQDEALARDLEEATWRLLRAETSCNFYWGEAWVGRSEADLVVSRQALERVRERLPEPPASPAPAEFPAAPDSDALAEPDALAGAPDSPAAAALSDPVPPSPTPTEGCQP